MGTCQSDEINLDFTKLFTLTCITFEPEMKKNDEKI